MTSGTTSATRTAAPSVSGTAKPLVWPVSPLQEGFVFHATYDERRPGLYGMQASFAIDGPLDVNRLERAVWMLFDRHPNLRACFHMRANGQIVQLIAPETHSEVWEFRDISAEPALLEDLLRNSRERNFDLTTAPLIRFLAVRLGPTSYHLAITNHHILLDGWSVTNMFSDLLAIYEADGTVALTPAPRYRDYLKWLTGVTGGERAESCWRAALDGLTSPTLICDSDEAPVSPNSLTHQVSRGLSARLVRAATDYHSTLNTLVSVAWGLTLAGYIGRTDVVFGITVSGRPADVPDADKLIGLFINTVPQRIRFSPNEKVRELVARVQAEQIALADSQHLGLARIQQIAGLGKLFDTGMVFENYPIDQQVSGTSVAGLTVTAAQNAGYDESHYPLGLIAVPGERLTFRLSYHPTQIGDRRARQILDTVTTILEELAKAGDTAVAALESLGEQQRRDALFAHHGWTAGYRPQRFNALFEESADHAPQRTALRVHNGPGYTYHEIERMAAILASRLRGRGVGAEKTVAIMMPRSAEVIVAILAIHKAGGTYLPLDRSQPPQRLAAIVAGTQPELVLLNAPADRSPIDGIDWLVVDLDELMKESTESSFVQTPPVHADKCLAASDDTRSAAYIIHTSGTTGTPKAVVVTHHGAVSFARFTARRFLLDGDSVVLHFASPSFDGLIGELVPAWLAGATVVVPPADVVGGQALGEFMFAHQVTHAVLPPAVATDLDDSVIERLTTLCLAGEACPPELVERWAPYTRIINGYGPTEMTVAISESEPLATDMVPPPLGTPVDDVRVYLLDAWLRPVPEGTIGELYATGPGMARGYRGQPAATATRFVADPFGESGGRLYRTGDFAVRQDGGLFYSGRVDEQIKVRGLRVDPREIENALTAHDDVDRAVVVGRRITAADHRLLAYVQPVPSAMCTPAVLKQHLAGILPRHLMPSGIGVVDSFPLTNNGKIDKKALPPLEIASTGRQPRSHAEEIIAGMFADLLGLSSVGIDDDFFESGGHSLLATRLVGRLRHAFEVDLPVREVFSNPTVARLAATVARGATVSRPRLRARRTPHSVVPMSFAQQRLWFLHRLDPASTGYTMALAFRATGGIDIDALSESVSRLVSRHEVLRTIYRMEGEPVQRILPADDPVVTAVTRLSERDVDQSALDGALAAAHDVAFDLENEPPLRFQLLHTLAGDHVVIISIHHIACDGESLAPLLAELQAGYLSARGLADDSADPLPLQYGDYALWQRRLLGTAEAPKDLATTQLDYWRTTLAGAPAQLNLPTDRPRPPASSLRGSVIRGQLEPSAARRVAELARSRNASVFMVLHTALALTLNRFGAGEDIVIGAPIAGRTDPGLDRLIGFFVNTVVLRTDLSGNPSGNELIDRVRAADLAAYANQDVPFERIVDEVNPHRATDRHPIFQVMLSFNAAAPTDQDASSEFSLIALPESGSRFDLGMVVNEEQDGGLSIGLNYSTDLFDDDTAERIATGFGSVLRELADHPDMPICVAIPLIAADQSRIDSWNAASGNPETATLTDLFDHTVRTYPDLPAVESEGEALTYAQLYEASLRIRGVLVSAGARPGSVVALMMPRGIDWIAALFAASRIGATFAVIDPSYPEHRISAMLATANADVVVTAADITDSVVSDTDIAVGESLAHVDQGAYVVFTSGSTGTPKAIVVSHRGIGAWADLFATHVGVGPGCRVLQLVSTSFDAALGDVFQSLLTGATLVLAPQQRPLGRELADFVEQQRITHMTVPPALLAGLRPGWIAPGKVITVTGEVCPPELAKDWTRTHTVINGYGPTEVTVGATLQIMPPGCELPQGAIPIGKPLAGKRIHILDDMLRPVPLGVAGEMYVAGGGLALGYLGNAEETAGSFVANPFGPPGQRMYATGDQGRWRRDGTIDYLGRRDEQVKIRGLRIELGEIERALLDHPSVSQVRVIVRRDNPSDSRLVAYVIPADPDGTIDTADVTATAAAKLPVFMIPSAVVAVSQWPLTANGKIDTAQLPAPAGQLASGGSARTSDDPRTELLRGLFADILGLAEVGPDDGFFDLGGHSLLAAALIERINDRLGYDLRVRDIFDAPSPAALAEVTRRRSQDTTTGSTAMLAPVVPIRERGEQPPLFCVHPLIGVGWPYFALGRLLDPGTPVYALQAPGLDGAGTIATSVAGIAAEHVKNMRKIQPHGPFRLLGWSSGGVIAHEIAAQLRAAHLQVDLVVIIDAYPPDPTAPPAPLNREDVIATVDAHHTAIAGDTETLDRIVDVAVATSAAVASHIPVPVDTDLLFFSAGRGPTADMSGTAAWAGMVGDVLGDIDIDMSHEELGSPAAFAAMATDLSATISASDIAPAESTGHRPAVRVRPRSVEHARIVADLNTVNDWIDRYVCEPHDDLGRTGPVCPFVRPAISAGELELRVEYGVAGVDRDELLHVLLRELRDFGSRCETSQAAAQQGQSGVSLMSRVLVLPDIGEADYRALDEVYPKLKETAVAHGLMVGQFHPHCDERAIRNPILAVSRSPLPLLAMRPMAQHDILFLSGDAEWFSVYRDRFGDDYRAGRIRDELMMSTWEAALRRFDTPSDADSASETDPADTEEVPAGPSADISGSAGKGTSQDAAMRMRHLLYGHLLAQAVGAFAVLGIPDVLADRSLTVGGIAEKVGADGEALSRLLDTLAVYDVVAADRDGRYALTEFGATLRSDAPATAGPTARLVGGAIGDSWNRLVDTVRTGRPSFDIAHGTSFFEFLEKNPDFRATFDSSQSAGLSVETDRLLAELPVADGEHIIDVGGGDGTLLELILRHHRHVRGTLVDLPSVVERARARLGDDPLVSRITFAGNNFDGELPSGGSTYLLRHIIHDWSDERCAALLRKCAGVLAPGGRVVLIDRIAGYGSADHDEERMTALMSLYMLAVVEGRERNRDEFEALLGSAGLRISSMTGLAGDTVAVVAVVDDPAPVAGVSVREKPDTRDSRNTGGDR